MVKLGTGRSELLKSADVLKAPKPQSDKIVTPHAAIDRLLRVILPDEDNFGSTRMLIVAYAGHPQSQQHVQEFADFMANTILHRSPVQ